MADPAALSAAKNALRKIIRRQLSGLSEDYLASQSRDACDRLGRSAVFQASRSVAVFLSMPKLEIDTSGIIASIRSSGRECFVPRVVGTNRDDMSLVHLHPSERVDDFPRDRWLIPDPPMLYTHISGAGRLLSRPCIRPQAPGEALYGSGPASLPPLDLVLVPGLAFSPNGLRLGHGKGYYDTFLAALLKRHAEDDLPRPFLMGLCLDCQLVDKACDGAVQTIAVGPHDLLVDAVLTPSNYFDSLAMRKSGSSQAGSFGHAD